MSEPREPDHDPLQGEIVHEYDGIREADNQLPRWWLGIFSGTIVFAFGYWFTYESWEMASTPRVEYAEELARAAAAGGVEVDDGLLESLATSEATVARGRASFRTNCAACHGDRAEGEIGPNLTDGSWLHGDAPTSVYHTIKDGYAPRGMPAWGPILGEAQVQALTAYVLSVRNTNVPGRAPEGVPAGTVAQASP